MVRKFVYVNNSSLRTFRLYNFDPEKKIFHFFFFR